MTSIDLLPDPTAPHDPDAEHWYAVVQEAATALRADVVERDRANQDPTAEIELLRAYGLLTLTLPQRHGGHGQPWRTGLNAARLIARTDASLAHILVYHYGWLRTIVSFGTEEADRHIAEAGAKALLWASPGTSREGLPAIAPDGENYLVTGDSGFATGAPVADRLFTRAVRSDTNQLLIAVTRPDGPGVELTGEWDTVGQRLTASRSIHYDRAPVPALDLLAAFGPLDQPPAPIWSMAVLNFQLAFAALSLGIAEGALLEARDYTRAHTRPWYHSLVDQGTQEPFILADYGTHVAELQAVSALVERAERALAYLYARTADGHDVTADERGQVAEIVAAAKVRAIHAGLAATSGLFDLTGARSTATAHGLDRFWRNLRTLSLHDPVAYKQHELGQYFVNGQLPTPSGYR
ncbi:acyl-CoA dehydrogenase family protein [Kitasatospora sp. NPDC057223]|uniref:acyl-CoA dehydrogenase family protein n=1 Tax=Kitasatospora sp. NPDC057223 TaxID=3346055 RepID=UPI0036310C3F